MYYSESGGGQYGCGRGVLLLNAYILYKLSHLLIWKTPKKVILSQCDFHRFIVLKWLGVEQDNNEESSINQKRQKHDIASVSASCHSSSSFSISIHQEKNNICH